MAIHIDAKPSDRVDASLLKAFKDKNPAELAGAVRRDAVNRMSDTYAVWRICLRMLAGDQWLYRNPVSPIIYRPQDMRDKKRPSVFRYTGNRIKPAFAMKMSRIGQVRHIPQVVPHSGQSTSEEEAHLCTRYLQALYWTQRHHQIHEDLKAWFTALGPSWSKITWDVKKDMPRWDVRSPFEVLMIPWGVRRPEEADAIYDVYATTVEQLQDRYPEEMKGITKEELDEEAGVVLGATDSFNTMQGAFRNIRGMMVLMEVRARPRKRGPFKQGYRMLCTNHRLLELQPLLDPDLPLGYFQHVYQVEPGAAYPSGMIRDMVGPQVARNKFLSGAMAYVDSHANAKLLLDRRYGITKKTIDDSSAAVEFEPEGESATPPGWLVRPNVQMDVFQLAATPDRDMDDVAGVHDVSRAVSPGSRMAGVAISNLQSRDEAHIDPVLRRFSDDCGLIYEHILELTRRHMHATPDLVGVDFEEFSAFALDDFKADKIPKRARVFVRTLSESTEDRAKNREMVMACIQAGLLADFKPKEIRRILQHGTDPTFYDTENDQRSRARRKARAILLGDVSLALAQYPWDDAQIFLEELVKVANHPSFERLPQERKAAMQTAIMNYQTLVQGQQQAQAGLMASERQLEPAGGQVPA